MATSAQGAQVAEIDAWAAERAAHDVVTTVRSSRGNDRSTPLSLPLFDGGWRTDELRLSL